MQLSMNLDGKLDTFKPQIRYAYGKKLPNNELPRKAVLYTFRKNDLLFFGIARCCKKDKFDREHGCFIASERAMKAFMQKQVLCDKDEESLSWFFKASKNKMWGVCNVNNIKTLMDHFYSFGFRRSELE